MGRMTQDNIVDIDLGKEGRANKVSRQQVQDGNWHLSLKSFVLGQLHSAYIVLLMYLCVLGITKAQGGWFLLPAKSRAKDFDCKQYPCG